MSGNYMRHTVRPYRPRKQVLDGRMVFLGVPVPVWKFMLVWPLPVYMAMAHDFRTKRMVHPVYVIGIAAMLTMRLVLPLSTSAAWQAVAAHITPFYPTPAGQGR